MTLERMMRTTLSERAGVGGMGEWELLGTKH